MTETPPLTISPATLTNNHLNDNIIIDGGETLVLEKIRGFARMMNDYDQGGTFLTISNEFISISFKSLVYKL